MMMKTTKSLVLTILFSVFTRHVVVQASTSTTRPPFLTHVTPEAIDAALKVAQGRHEQAVHTALSNYNVDAITDPIDHERLESIQLREYTIEAPGTLPDFQQDLPRKVFVTDPPLFTAEECASVIQFAEDHFQGGPWTMQRSGQYQVAGFWIKNVPAVHEWFTRAVKTQLFPLLVRTFPEFCENPDDLCVDNAYLFKYTAETGRRTDVHTDSGCLAFTIALNPKEEYSGGGTWFEGLQKEQGEAAGNVLEMDVGQVTVRPGGLKHCGYAVQSGTRYIIGGFCMHRKKCEPVRMLLTPIQMPEADEQRRLLEAAATLNPNCDAVYNLLANQYEAAGDKVKAQQVLEYCLENVHSGSGEVAYSLGSLYLEQSDYQKAMHCMKVCLETDEYDVDAMMGLAQIYAALGDSDNERKYCQNVVATPGADAAVVATAYCNLGVLSEGTDQEIHFYKKSLEFAPLRFAPHYSLGAAHASQQQWPEAVAAYRKAVDLADSEEKSNNALHSLYRAAMELIRSDTSVPAPQSREEMMQRFKDAMGVENYERLASGAAGSQQ